MLRDLSPALLIRHALGVGVSAAAAWGAYWVWSNYLWIWNRALLPNPLRDHPLAESLGVDALRLIRTVAVEQRFVIMLIAAMLAVTLIDWLWRQTVGRIGEH